ncbi:MAG: 3-dehydroquinate synthase [Desulfurococcales archaeon]|jgi:3-dehydroquinate synthase|nr:3-dehydroquinate synthase [Desulfurococcales archaeon]
MRIYVSRLCYTDTKIVVGRNTLDLLKEIEGEAVLLHSKRIDPSYISRKMGKAMSIIAIEDGEKVKDVEKVLEIVRMIHRNAPPDFDWIIAAGGGTVLDVAGFIASIYRRGVKLANIPTTFLGMVDAAMGGKNGVNLDGVKNIIGTFYQPHLVVSDISFLATLPLDELLNGLAEVIKYCITLDKELCYLLENKRREILVLDGDTMEEIIYRSAVNKMKIVEIDERDNKGIRIVLNYGHTIGHAIEAGSRFSIPHGRAISVGMVCEAHLAEKLEFIRRDVVEYLVEILRSYRLPISVKDLNVSIDIDLAIEALRRDKKRRRGSIVLPILSGIGAWERIEIDIKDLEECLKLCLG